MQILAIHDEHGEVTAVVIGPADESAPAGVLAQRGHAVSAVEVADIPDDVRTEDGQRRVRDLLENSRIDFDREARLVPKGS